MNNTVKKQHVEDLPIGINDPKYLESALIYLVELASGLNSKSKRRQIKAIKLEFELYGNSAIKDSFTHWLAKSNGKNFSKEEFIAMITRIRHELDKLNNVN